MPVPTMLKAALPSIPGVNQLPGIRKDPGVDPSTLSFTRTGLTIERSHAAPYARVCGFEPRDTVPLPYPHVLAFPLHLEALTSRQFPFPAIGTLHLENTISSHRPLRPGEVIDVRVRVSATRAHAKGTVVDFLAEVHVGDELVWESTSTYLRRGRGDDAATGGLTFERTPDATVEWRLAGDLGRRYAAVSGDRNPIHLHPLTAKAFGFPRHIAHGMWSLARCVAALENRLPDAVTVEAAFKKPILLPGTVGFGHEQTSEGQAFALTSPKDGAPHLLGRAFGP
ncbi:MAG: MaoC/PaaZ C-terminal domain-containing protein [Nocardioides sp.]